MKNIMKKIMIFSLVGIMQVGLGATVIEASPRDYDERMEHHDNRDHHWQEEHERHEWERHERERHERFERERHHREEVENRRHEEEMHRHWGENYYAWLERQRFENERHDEAMRRIAHDILDVILDH